MEERSIEFQYIFSDDYNPIYCNGAYGGVSTQGEIIVNFYLERMPIPNKMTHKLNADGTLGRVEKTDPDTLDSKVIRFVSSGIILSESSAKSIYNWLGSKINELEAKKATSFVESGKKDEIHE